LTVGRWREYRAGFLLGQSGHGLANQLHCPWINLPHTGSINRVMHHDA
jgi:hypothetical protein